MLLVLFMSSLSGFSQCFWITGRVLGIVKAHIGFTHVAEQFMHYLTDIIFISLLY